MNFLDKVLNPVDASKEVIRSLFEAIASDFITSGMKYMSEYIARPNDFAERIPHYNDLILGTQALGSGLVLVFFYFRIMGALRDLVTDENEANFAEIIGSTAIAMGMVWSFVPFMNRCIFPIAAWIVKWIGSFTVEVQSAGQILDKISPDGGLSTAAVHILLVALLFGIGAFALAIVALIRFAHLTICMVCGPILMATYANRNGMYKSYFLTVITLVFTQTIHMLCFALVIWTAAVGTFEMLMLSLSFCIVGIMGPFVLRQWLFSSGVAGGATGGAKFLSVSLLFRR